MHCHRYDVLHFGPGYTHQCRLSENNAIGSNNWFSIFTSYTSKPIDNTTSGRGGGFGNGGDLMNLFKRYRSYSANRTIRKLVVQVPGADLVATFRPNQP